MNLIGRYVKVVKIIKEFDVIYPIIGMKGTIVKKSSRHNYVINWDNSVIYPHDKGWFVDERSIECVYKNCKSCEHKIECITS